MLERLSPTTRIALRVTTGIAGAIAAGLATLILTFIGAATATGCFIECGDDPSVVGGGLLLAGAVTGASLTVTSIVCGVIGWNRRVLSRVAAVAAALATLAVLVLVSAF